jgi:hypothetical protein
VPGAYFVTRRKLPVLMPTRSLADGASSDRAEEGTGCVMAQDVITKTAMDANASRCIFIL